MSFVTISPPTRAAANHASARGPRRLQAIANAFHISQTIQIPQAPATKPAASAAPGGVTSRPSAAATTSASLP